MTHWAAPGVQCVCINDDFGSWNVKHLSLPIRQPMISEVLTVSRVKTIEGVVALTFEEIDEYQCDTDGASLISGKIFWFASCFRPLIKRRTDISIFKAMLTPAGKQVADA
jgi:hypothetical protein